MTVCKVKGVTALMKHFPPAVAVSCFQQKGSDKAAVCYLPSSRSVCCGQVAKKTLNGGLN